MLENKSLCPACGRPENYIALREGTWVRGCKYMHRPKEEKDLDVSQDKYTRRD